MESDLIHLESFAEGRGVFYSRIDGSPDLGLVSSEPAPDLIPAKYSISDNYPSFFLQPHRFSSNRIPDAGRSKLDEAANLAVIDGMIG